MGLCNSQKRNNIFSWLNTYHYRITLLQETHSVVSDEQTWVKELHGQIIFSHGCKHSRGVAILIFVPTFKPDFEILSTHKDAEGKIFLTECNVENNIFAIINVY